MKSVYRIVEWRERYEVGYKGESAKPKPGEKLRAGKLSFVRLKVHGHSQGTGLRRLKKIAGSEKLYGVFGIFCKFLEIAGNNTAILRGWLLDEKNNPADAENLAFITDAPTKQVDFALECLTNPLVGWLEVVKIPENPGNFEEFSASYITEPNRTEPNSIQDNPTEPKGTQTETPTGGVGSGGSVKDFSPDAVSVESDRVKLYDSLLEIFRVARKEDRAAILWVCDQTVNIKKSGKDDTIFSTVWELAKESTEGNKPIALFISKLKNIGIRK